MTFPVHKQILLAIAAALISLQPRPKKRWRVRLRYRDESDPAIEVDEVRVRNAEAVVVSQQVGYSREKSVP